MSRLRRLLLTLRSLALVVAVAAAAALAADNHEWLHDFAPRRCSRESRQEAPSSRSSPSATRCPAATASSRSRTGSRCRPRGNGRLDVYVNHETSTVPFPYTPAPRPRRTQNDFDECRGQSSSRSTSTAGGVLNAAMVIASELENYQRFCSNFLATAAEGFDRELLSRTRRRPTSSTGPERVAGTDERTPPAEQAGVVVAYDVKTGEAQADLRHGPAQPREQRRDPGLRRSRRPLGRRHVHARTRRSPSSTRTSRPTRTRSGTTPAAVRLPWSTIRVSTTTTTCPDRLDRFISRDVRPQIDPAVAKGTQTALETASDDSRECSSSSASRTSPTTSGRAGGTSSTSPTRDVARTRRTATRSPLGTAGSGSWFTIPTIRRRSPLSLLVEGDDQPGQDAGQIHQPDNLETTPPGVCS